jgi:hypothetical protein
VQPTWRARTREFIVQGQGVSDYFLIFSPQTLWRLEYGKYSPLCRRKRRASRETIIYYSEKQQ